MITIEDSTSRPTIAVEAVSLPSVIVIEEQSTTAVVQHRPSVYDIEPDWSGITTAGWIMLAAVLLIPRVFNLSSVIGFLLGGVAFAASVLASCIILLST